MCCFLAPAVALVVGLDSKWRRLRQKEPRCARSAGGCGARVRRRGAFHNCRAATAQRSRRVDGASIAAAPRRPAARPHFCCKNSPRAGSAASADAARAAAQEAGKALSANSAQASKAAAAAFSTYSKSSAAGSGRRPLEAHREEYGQGDQGFFESD